MNLQQLFRKRRPRRPINDDRGWDGLEPLEGRLLMSADGLVGTDAPAVEASATPGEEQPALELQGISGGIVIEPYNVGAAPQPVDQQPTDQSASFLILPYIEQKNLVALLLPAVNAIQPVDRGNEHDGTEDRFNGKYHVVGKSHVSPTPQQLGQETAAFGLGHTNDTNDVMYPSIVAQQANINNTLSLGDIELSEDGEVLWHSNVDSNATHEQAHLTDSVSVPVEKHAAIKVIRIIRFEQHDDLTGTPATS